MKIMDGLEQQDANYIMFFEYIEYNEGKNYPTFLIEDI
jgi:hypothetical protein